MPDIALSLEDQLQSMKKYVSFTKKQKMREFLAYAGYFRVSRYGKYLISHTSQLRCMPKQQLLFDLYQFDTELRKLLFHYCKKAEIQFKSHMSNAISLKLSDPYFYLSQSTYNPTKSDRDKLKRQRNKKAFARFWNSLIKSETDLRTNTMKYPELSEFRSGGAHASTYIPCWAAFSFFEFGTICTIYQFLRGDLKTETLKYGYSNKHYKKSDAKMVETWLDAIRNLRNVCAHHNRLCGRTSSIVLTHGSEQNLVYNDTDLFSRLYALKKILSQADSNALGKDLEELINRSKTDVYLLQILSSDWKQRYDSINYL